ELSPEDGQAQRIYCKQCSKPMRLSYGIFDRQVEHIRLTVEGLPLLHCDACKRDYLPDRSRWELILLFHEGDKANQTKIYVKRPKPKEKFALTEVPFRYASDDYYYLPGLFRKNSPGFLTPIYFNKS